MSGVTAIHLLYAAAILILAAQSARRVWKSYGVWWEYATRPLTGASGTTEEVKKIGLVIVIVVIVGGILIKALSAAATQTGAKIQADSFGGGQ